MAVNPSRVVFMGRARLFRTMREAAMNLLYPTKPVPGGGLLGKTDQILNDLANSFSRFAGNQQTAFDNGNGRSASSGGNVMELQVESAMSKVLGRALGRGGTRNFMTALNAAFPTVASGMVVDSPQRGVISLNNGGGILPYTGSSSSNDSSKGLVGQLSTKQAALYREASIIAEDAIKILTGLETFMPEADVEEVEALRSLVQAEINAFVEEVGRVDEPRETRVEAYLNALNINLIEFGRRGLLDNPRLVTTINDEVQTAGFQLLKNYAGILRTIWDNFNTSVRIVPTFSLSEQIERANVVLPVLAQSNVDFEAALDSVAFTEREQRSRAARFSELDGNQITLSSRVTLGGIVFTSNNLALYKLILNLGLQLPDFTVRDLADWLDRFANTEGPSILVDSGQYGLDFVLNEADTLFWKIVPVIGMRELLEAANSTNQSMLRQILSNERVRWALGNLLDQLKVLADLAA